MAEYTLTLTSEQALLVCKWRNDDVHAHHKGNEA